jgi:hypothetical protein
MFEVLPSQNVIRQYFHEFSVPLRLLVAEADNCHECKNVDNTVSVDC